MWDGPAGGAIKGEDVMCSGVHTSSGPGVGSEAKNASRRRTLPPALYI